MIVLGRRDLAALLPMPDVIEAVDAVMRRVSAREAELPLRSAIGVGGPNRLGVMPGALPGAGFGAKLLALYPGNPASGRSSHQGLMCLFEPEHGDPVAVLPADVLTALRTAAASAVATRALSRPEAAVLAIVGTGEEARHHVAAMRAVRPVRELRIAGRTPEKARAFAAEMRAAHPDLAVAAAPDVPAAVAGADLICTVTSAAEPVLMAADVPQGAHVNAVGASIPTKIEIDPELALRAELYTDYRPSLFAQAGEVIGLISAGRADESLCRAEIGEVLSGTRPGRSSPEAVTLYRSLGVAAQDLATAALALARATAAGVGARVSLD